MNFLRRQPLRVLYVGEKMFDSFCTLKALNTFYRLYGTKKNLQSIKRKNFLFCRTSVIFCEFPLLLAGVHICLRDEMSNDRGTYAVFGVLMTSIFGKEIPLQFLLLIKNATL